MNCDWKDCKKPFTHGQAVFVSENDRKENVNLCSEKCCKKFESEMKQLEMFPKRRMATFSLEQLTLAGCRIQKVPVANGNDGVRVKLDIDLPNGVSVDQIIMFMRGPVRLMVFNEHLEFQKVPGETDDTDGDSKIDKQSGGSDKSNSTLDDFVAPEEGTRERCLYDRLHYTDDAPAIWSKARDTGLNDLDLTAAIAYQFINDGGEYHGHKFEVKAGTPPKFWWDSGKAVSGKALLKLVREILHVPEKEDEDE